MSNSSIISNTGTAVHLVDGDSLEISNSVFFNNSSPRSGGAIMSDKYGGVKVVNTRFSQNTAVNKGGAICVERMSKLKAQNCTFTDNIAQEGGAIDALYSGSLVMSNCLVFNNSASGNGGAVGLEGSKVTVTTSVFKMNRAHGSGGVFAVKSGTMYWMNSWFTKNFARVYGGVLRASLQAVINITESFCSENKAKNAAVLVVSENSKIRISNTQFNQNLATDMYGAMLIDENSILELYGSQIDDNKAEQVTGALRVVNNSLLVAINSSFKGNSAVQSSSISVDNSTAYLENCTFMENRVTYFTGTINTAPRAKLKISNTVFTQNEGYDLYYLAESNRFINKFETHKCLFIHDNVLLKSNTKGFEDAAVKEKFIGQRTVYNQTLFTIRETPYASSKLFDFLNIFNIKPALQLSCDKGRKYLSWIIS